MSDTLRKLVQEHHAFYEVLPYYITLQENQRNSAATTRRIQAGFDVDIYGTETNNELAPPGPDYALGHAACQEIAEAISHHHSNSCSIEAIPFPSTVVLDPRKHFQAQGMLRIRISHYGALDQPAGEPEQHALEQIEDRLQSLGVARR